MKKIVMSLLVTVAMLIGIVGTADAASKIRGYYRSNGTYVQPHYRSSPNSSRWDNYSTRGNYNPFTGKKGYSSPYKNYRGW